VKVLFTCVIGHGHFHPMVPLARAMEAAGHRVIFATDPRFCAYIRGVGFEVYPAGLDQPEAMARFVAATPGWSTIRPEDRMYYQYPGLFAEIRVPPMLDDLRGIVADQRPDLIVHEAGEMAGGIAAELASIAHVEHAFGILRPVAVRRRATDLLGPVSDRLGVPNPGVGGLGGELYLDICPPGVQQSEIAEVANVQRLRPMGFDTAPDASLPAWVAALPARPTVYVTMGTVFNDAADVFRAVLEGLRDEPVNVIVTVGADGDPSALGPQPDNVHVERYIPQSQLLPKCDLFVSHAGSGALLGALNAGVPMLAIPQGADQFFNAARIVEVGLGLRLMPAELDAAAVREAIRELLEDGRFAAVARTQKAAIEAMPSPAEVVPILEALAA
jgi:UDP:flavonoid glycosyltransferase YjiC (YdhE family)